MIPEFAPAVTMYTAETTNATNVIKAVAADPAATVEITLGEAEVENGKAATWQEGENRITITVTNGEQATVYGIVVTKKTEG